MFPMMMMIDFFHHLRQFNFDWSFYWCMLALITVWNCGFTAITRKGKIGYPILEFFQRKKKIEEYFPDAASEQYDKELLLRLPEDLFKKPADELELLSGELEEKVNKFMEEKKILSPDQVFSILYKLSDEKDFNSWYHIREVPVFPDWISYPIVACITCIASVHSLVIYTVAVLCLGFYWNPLEWISLAIPASFTGEFFWKLKLKIEHKLDK